MSWREGNRFPHANRDWRRGAVGAREEEEEALFRDEGRGVGGRLGFHAGLDYGRQTGAGQATLESGDQRWGFRPRGGRSAGARRGGFAGRPGRGTNGCVRLGQVQGSRGGHWPVATGEGRTLLGQAAGNAGSKEKVGKDGAAMTIAGGSGPGNGGGAIRVGEMDAEVRPKPKRDRDIDEMEEDVNMMEPGCELSRFETRESSKEGGGPRYCSKCTQKGHMLAECPNERGKKESKLALVRVVGGSLAKEKLIE
ncbi:hypothetical protein E2562_011317 [Oryza meyeriana var. granulata]|uniref:CCHC-type domain-containing protein n=1 Tax=Oryza meyeriana var. granulata TaxID=110450 RepID=A0A6G1BUZ3_9ORYZ|nr:hypothetical protein E2562_011317 [Oryza meyeriana var. granulata]